MCVNMCRSVGVHGRQKLWLLLELELQAAVIELLGPNMDPLQEHEMPFARKPYSHLPLAQCLSRQIIIERLLISYTKKTT